jgi:transcriptional regulator with XRE-family HTH domain
MGGRAVLEHVGRNLRRLRRERDLTQAQVARFAGIRQQELSAIERGLRPKSALLDRLAFALGVPTEDLLRAPIERLTREDDRLPEDDGHAR